MEESTRTTPEIAEEGGSSLGGESSGHDQAVPAMVPVAGIGASAGGLEVFKQLLGDLPGDTGFAIVFIQHLDPTHASVLTEILARATPMPVSEAADGMLLEANHVYVIPATADMTVARGALRLCPRAQLPGLHMPIDRFLRSAADQCGSRTMGVILSGSGSDGAAGVQAIKAAGGVTFAQETGSARFASMPQAAVATGCVDFLLPPEGIAGELVRISRHPYMVEAPHALPEAPSAPGEEWFGKILDTLHGATGIDFSLYRENMVKRRILRRLALRNIATLPDYSALLNADPAELVALQRDLLIGVTGFFRDPESFERLKQVVFPNMLEGRRTNDPIRIWVAGCATGEEAFSIAICLHEFLHQNGAVFPVQMFASDVSLPAIERARTGRYLENIGADLTQERLNRYFTKIDGGYQISKTLRDMCVFTRHNLIEDPPFSRLDLVSCRNVLTYLRNAHNDILPVFHYALKPNGFLWLGAPEGAASGDLFSVADHQHRIYAKRETAKKTLLFQSANRRGSAPTPAVTPSTTRVSWDSLDVGEEADRILLARYSPAGVVVDENLEVVEIRGHPSPYLVLPVGKVSFNLIKLIPDVGLFLELEKLIQQARKTGEPVRKDRVPYEDERRAGSLTVEVVPLDGHSGATLILFEPVTAVTPQDTEPLDHPPEGDARDRQISRLKQQLADARQRFVSAMEEHQLSREENQNTTEEALSANEELQSLNEELETAKEELQSANEELVTVNDELQAKNAALARTRDFAMSIVETVRQPLLVLDADLRIRMANQAFCRTFRVSRQEAEGRVIYSLARGVWDLPGLRDSIDSILHGRRSFAEFEVEQDFPSVGRRSLVVAGCSLNDRRMILLAVDDITEGKLAQQALRKSEEHLRESQKMEAVGRLAGGIAHDFNNLLTAIIGYSSLLCDHHLSGNESALQQVLEIRTAGEKAASLTKQLLAFSRRQILHPKVFDVNAVVADFDRMLRHLVGERIEVAVHCEPNLWQARADPGEIGRAVMNLSLNARDAMPTGGTLTIETANLTVTETDARRLELAPGRYVMLAVHDNGIGIGEESRAHIFEPFFTTKEIGKGTGLGLATVLGIVEQSGGAIRCESEVGKGTTFRIFLPAVAARVEKRPVPAADFAQAPKGSEVILLVEDEDAVRKLARTILEASGYKVIDVRNGREGLDVCETHPGPIDLLISDVVMPELGGRELAEGAVKLRPGLKVLFISGHTPDVVLREGLEKGAAFLQKPFTPTGLAEKVRQTMDSDSGAAAV